MFTINYKGFHIHGYFDKSECRVNDTLACGRILHFKSLHAAKCHITRVMVPAHDAAMAEFVRATV